MKKWLSLILTAVMLLSMTVGLAGCGGSNSTVNDEHTIKVLYEGWVNGIVPTDYEKNPYKKVIDEKYDCDWQLNLTTNMNDEIMKRFSSTSGDKPDVIIFNDFNQLKSLYNQGFLVKDYTPYMSSMPNLEAYYKENKDKIGSIYSDEGMQMCVMYPSDSTDWSFRIRKDWVEQWNADSGTSGNPKTVDELLDMARWVKRTKGNGYYLFTSSGENETVGHVKHYLFMFSEHDDWYVNDQGELSHPILDGSYEKFLNFMRTVVSEGLIDPDWYTQSWGNHKTNLYNGRIGIDWYSPALAIEYAEGTTQEQKSGIWTTLEMPTDDPSIKREGVNFTRIGGYKIAINKNCSDEKIRKILTIFNDMMWQETDDIGSSLYYQLRWGINIDNYTLEATDKENELVRVLDADGNDTGYYAYYAMTNKDNHQKASYGCLWDYGVPIQTVRDNVIEHGKMTAYTDASYDYIQLVEQCRAYYAKQTKLNYGDMIRSVDPKLVNYLESLINEFDINYIQQKNTMSYEEFVEKWLDTGAVQMQNSAYQQLKALGYIEE